MFGTTLEEYAAPAPAGWITTFAVAERPIFPTRLRPPCDAGDFPPRSPWCMYSGFAFGRSMMSTPSVAAVSAIGVP
jgi:hypothetical protein